MHNHHKHHHHHHRHRSSSAKNSVPANKHSRAIKSQLTTNAADCVDSKSLSSIAGSVNSDQPLNLSLGDGDNRQKSVSPSTPYSSISTSLKHPPPHPQHPSDLNGGRSTSAASSHHKLSATKTATTPTRPQSEDDEEEEDAVDEEDSSTCYSFHSDSGGVEKPPTSPLPLTCQHNIKQQKLIRQSKNLALYHLISVFFRALFFFPLFSSFLLSFPPHLSLSRMSS